MKDKNRIKEIVDLLQEYWNKNSQLRLGQILDSIRFDANISEVFYLTDEEIIKYFKKELEK